MVLAFVFMFFFVLTPPPPFPFNPPGTEDPAAMDKGRYLPMIDNAFKDESLIEAVGSFLQVHMCWEIIQDGVVGKRYNGNNTVELTKKTTRV
jgi:hypothetical protein